MRKKAGIIVIICSVVLAVAAAVILAAAPWIILPAEDVSLSAEKTVMKKKIEADDSKNHIYFDVKLSKYYGQNISILDENKKVAGHISGLPDSGKKGTDDLHIKVRIPDAYMDKLKTVWYVRSESSRMTNESELLKLTVKLENDCADFERPVEGSHVWNLLDGRAGTIAAAGADTLYVMTKTDGIQEWSKEYTMINLPDIIAHINYDITNAYSSLFRINGGEIPEVTGRAIYCISDGTSADKVKKYNRKTGKKEFLVPAQYYFAMDIAAAQKRAEKKGWRLHIYDTFRPSAVSGLVYDAAGSFPAKVFAPYTPAMFIAPAGVSYHNGGMAVDTSVDEWNKSEKKWVEKDFGGPMHELSPVAAFHTGELEELFAECDTIVSEWWHFQRAVPRSQATVCAGNVSDLYVYTMESLSVPRSKM